MNKNLGQVFTPKSIANKMIDLFDIDPNSKILDPCFGGGIFLETLREHGYNNLFGIELDKKLFNSINNHDYKLENISFLETKYNNEFDGIIINPPYIRQEEFNNLQEYGITKKYLKNKFENYNISARSNMYCYFILKCIESLKENGELIAIIPKTWNQTQSGKLFEKEILQKVDIEEKINLKPNVFDGALVDADIIKFKKTVSDKENKKSNINENHVFLNKIAKCRRGLTSGDNKFFIFNKNNLIFSKKYFTPILSSPKQVSGYNTLQCKEYDYILTIKDNYNKLDTDVKNYIDSSNKEHKNQSWYKIAPFECNGLIFGYIIRDNIKFITNDANILVRDNFYVIYSYKESNELLMALLNNYYVYSYLEKVGKHYGNGILKLQKYDMDTIPIINPDVISEDDKLELIKISKNMNIDSVEKISDILEKYEKLKKDEIKKKYQNQIKIRKNGEEKNDKNS